MTAGNKIIEVTQLNIGYGGNTVLQNINFDVYQGEILFILGDSGCGKSTLLKHLTGLYKPMSGDIKLRGKSIVNAQEQEKKELYKSFGVTYQGGALLGSLTVAQNVAFPLKEHTNMSEEEIDRTVKEKLSLVNLSGFENYFPSELSGGMKKRAGLARALALAPDLLFFDEPSAGLDPLASSDLDKLILDLRKKINATIVVVSHELDSILSTADRIIMLNKERKTIVAEGNALKLRDTSSDPWVRNFLNRNFLKQQTGTIE